MLRVLLMLVCIGFLGLTGCQSAQEREAEAKADIEEERLEATKKYRECIEKHEGEANAKEQCAHLKEVVDTLKN